MTTNFDTEVRIDNELGLHARAAAAFVKKATEFSSDVKVAHGDNETSGKSITGLIMLAAGKGSVIKISACGSDSETCVRELEKLVLDKFGENK